MPTIERHDVDNVNAILTITATPADYADKIKAELNKLRKKANMKGFRAGKAPLSIVKKMYGKQVVFDVVNEVIATSLNEYMEDLDRDALGQPIPMVDDEVKIDFKVDNKEKPLCFRIPK